MGQSVSIDNCKDLSHLPAEQWEALAAEDITVVRSSGEIQAGWRFPKTPHFGDCTVHSTWVRAHVTLSSCETEGRPIQKYHMIHDRPDRDPNLHVCGWRRERTFWPTRLDGDEEGKKVWWEALDAMTGSLRIRDNIPVEELAVLDAAQQKLTDLELAERASQNAEESMTPTRKSFTDHIMDLQKINVWHADRVRRLFDSGFPKSKVAEICEIADDDARQKRLDEEEAALYLEPMAMSD